MRVLARREPTFGLHLHVGVDEPEDAMRVFNRMRAHLPLLLALSANSPFWQGRDTGMRSARTPLFQGFPRVGVPRAFEAYADWVEAVDVLLRCEAVPEPSFLWWDIRLQPRFGTVEIRVLDAQAQVGDTLALAALFQCVARLELERGHASKRLLESPEALSENRFLAARDGMEAQLLDPARDRLRARARAARRPARGLRALRPRRSAAPTTWTACPGWPAARAPSASSRARVTGACRRRWPSWPTSSSPLRPAVERNTTDSRPVVP